MCVCVHVQTGLPIYICVSVLRSGIDFRQKRDNGVAFFFLASPYWCVIAHYFVLINLQPEVDMSL